MQRGVRLRARRWLVGRVILAAVVSILMLQPRAVAALPAVSLVTTGSPVSDFPRNVQAEPAVALDAHRPNVLAAGTIDLVDHQPCPEASRARGHCVTSLNLGRMSVQFSFDGGHSWVQPSYTGLTSADCSPTTVCEPHDGPIATLPWYAENGLVAFSDPALAFGPRPVDGRFSWENGSRLYYANVALHMDPGEVFPELDTFRGPASIAVSRIDTPTEESVLDKNSWMPPVIATTRTSATTFEDKEQIWADNAATSHYFGNVYVCVDEYRSLSRGRTVQTVEVATSRDGGNSWSTKQVRQTARNAAVGNHQVCSIRTDSLGVVYLFYTHFTVGFPASGAHVLQKSFDGGETWTRPREVVTMNDGCFHGDLLVRRCVSDGLAGARTDAMASPSVDIANGAPTGTDATDQIVDVWSDGRFGLDNEVTMLSYSTDGGRDWSPPTVVSEAGHRPIYSAPAIAPDGSALYVVYQALTDPWRGSDMASSRGQRGVFRRAPIGPDGAPGSWSTLVTGPLGDVRASSVYGDIYAEFVGDYVYAAASRSYGVGVWTDVSDAAVCAAVQDYRAASVAAGVRALALAPWPLEACPPTFGNSQILAATSG